MTKWKILEAKLILNLASLFRNVLMKEIMKLGDDTQSESNSNASTLLTFIVYTLLMHFSE